MSKIEKQLARNGFAGQRLNYCVIASPRTRLVYADNPKVACTTIKRFLYTSEAIAIGDSDFESKLDQKLVSVHHRTKMPLTRFTQLDAKTRQAALEGEDYFRFSFVRHPAARALSGYLNKIYRKPNSPQRARLFDQFNLDMQDEISFESFLDFVAAQAPEARDHHWIEQTRNLCAKIIPYNLIGRLENFDRDFQAVEERVPKNLRSSVRRSKNKTNATSRLDEYMTQSAAAKIFEIYRSDFEQFGYARLELTAVEGAVT